MKHISKIYPKKPSICNCLNVRRASRAISQFYDGVLEPSGLTIAQLGLLKHLESAKSATITDLARMMRIDRTTLNRNTKPLIEAGLIEVNPGQDSRTRQVTLTKEGTATISKASAMWEEAQQSLQEYLGEEALSTLIQLLAKLEALVP